MDSTTRLVRTERTTIIIIEKKSIGIISNDKFITDGSHLKYNKLLAVFATVVRRLPDNAIIIVRMLKTICFPNAEFYSLRIPRCQWISFSVCSNFRHSKQPQLAIVFIREERKNRGPHEFKTYSNTPGVHVPWDLNCKTLFSDHERFARTRLSSTNTNVSNFCTRFLRRLNGEKSSSSDERAHRQRDTVLSPPIRGYRGEWHGMRRITWEMCLWETGDDLLFWARFSRVVNANRGHTARRQSRSAETDFEFVRCVMHVGYKRFTGAKKKKKRNAKIYCGLDRRDRRLFSRRRKPHLSSSFVRRSRGRSRRG